MFCSRKKEMKHPKWIEWCNKDYKEQEKIAEQNKWDWYFEWDTTGDILRYKYEKADKDPLVANKYGGYNRWYEKHKKGYSNVYVGADGRIHKTEKPIREWTIFNVCTNTECPYQNDKECGYFGSNEQAYDCFSDLFASIQAYIDICGIKDIDKLAKDFNIHKDIIGWFKKGNKYFEEKEGGNMKMTKEAIDEIVYLLEEVKDVVRLLKEWGIDITSDPWTATSFNDEENILAWRREDFEKFNTEINEGDMFFIGGNIVTGYQHDYKNKTIIAPKELAEIEAKIFTKYLKSIVDSISLKHFTLKLKNPYGLTDNCGWENWIDIEATILKSGLEKEIKYIDNKTINKLNKYEILILATETFTQILYYLETFKNVKNISMKIGEIKYDGWTADLICELKDNKIIFKHIRDFDKKEWKAKSLTEQLIYAWGFKTEMDIFIDFDIVNKFYNDLNKKEREDFDFIYDEAHSKFW